MNPNLAIMRRMATQGPAQRPGPIANFNPTALTRLSIGPDMRGLAGIFARGNAPQAGLNQFNSGAISPDAIQRRMANVMQGQNKQLAERLSAYGGSR